MRPAKQGDTVRVHYRGKLRDGSMFDASFDREPVQFTIGKGQVIPGFEEAVVGMNPGDSKTTELPVEKAFGPYREGSMGAVLIADMGSKILNLSGVKDIDVEVVFDPPWDPSMMSDAAKIELGFM